jgi:hypothetical protein
MPVKFDVIYNGYFIHYTIADPWTIAELHDGYKLELLHRDSKPHVVHSITDFSKVKQIPSNWLTAKAGPGLKHERSGEMLFVGLSRPMKLIVDTILKLTSFKRVRLFDTMDEAHAYARALLEKDQPARV